MKRERSCEAVAEPKTIAAPGSPAKADPPESSLATIVATVIAPMYPVLPSPTPTISES